MSITTSTVPADDLSDEDLLSEPIPVRMLAFSLRLFADHKGRESATPWRIKNAIFPLNPEVTHDLIDEMLLRLDAIRWLALYAIDGRTYFQIRQVGGQSQASRPSKFPDAPGDAFTRAQTRPDAFRTDSGLWGESASEGERAHERARAGASGPTFAPPEPNLMSFAPPLFCSDHMPFGTSEPCVVCKDFRRARDDWELRNGIRPLPKPASRDYDPDEEF